LAGGLAGGALSEGVRQLAQGRRPSFGDLLITPGNAKRLADRLSEMRGAAMKVGQLLSMESGELIPPILSEVLSRLRESAHTMPLGEVAQVLNGAWGDEWDRNFKKFSFTPLSAASIGQVHEAILRDGSRLAIKIQYPGIRRSIDSDVDNVGTLLRMLSLVPKEVDFAPLLKEAKRQLHAEADYRQEARFIRRFARHLGEDARFEMPSVIEPFTTSEVLAMSYLDGQPIETLANAETSVRNSAAASLTELALRELFEWGLVQTDPNFANYRYHYETRRLQLMDFGATREYPITRRTALQALLLSCIDGDDGDVARSATNVGYLDEGDPQTYRESIVALLRTATEPVRLSDHYDFGGSGLARRMSDIALDLRLREKYGRLPPPDVLFLHRKLGGLYLLLSRLRAKIPVSELIKPFLEPIDRKNHSRDDRLTG
jgi:predicted unusual protein kinase regulating ubiquinone biosynthesis (AarF/ABC1/UbiB family)